MSTEHGGQQSGTAHPGAVGRLGERHDLHRHRLCVRWALAALRWPEREQVSVPAGETYDEPIGGEPLHRVHECVLGVLALESEPVDPRL